MKVLVTGGAGYIGSHTCLALLELGYDVVAVDNFCNSSPESLKRVEELTGKKVPLYGIDVRDEAALDRVFREHDIGCAIHFAGLKAVGESVQIPLAYYENNLLSTMTLLKVMGKNGVKKIIFSSSATVYSTENTMPLNETGRMGCTNPYGWTKFMCEEIIRDYVKADPEWSAVLLRYFNPVGAHPSGRIGEAPNGIPNNLMPFITQTACPRRHLCPGLYPRDGPGRGPRRRHRLPDGSHRHRGLQPGHGSGVLRPRYGQGFPGGQRSGPAPPHRAPAAGRHRRLLRRSRQEPAAPSLDRQADAAGYVRRRLALAAAESPGVRRIAAQPVEPYGFNRLCSAFGSRLYACGVPGSGTCNVSNAPRMSLRLTYLKRRILPPTVACARLYRALRCPVRNDPEG